MINTLKVNLTVINDQNNTKVYLFDMERIESWDLNEDMPNMMKSMQAKSSIPVEE